MLVGLDTFDDTGIVQVSDELAILHTADLITPVVDDPFAFGRIAAANSLSDVYAMGGEPLSALNIVAWPPDADDAVLVEILRGGADACREAGCPIVGGHTIDDEEPKYGLSVTGTINPGRIARNVGARPDDILFLTKPLGTGILATAVKGGLASPEQIEAMTGSMSSLNRAAARVAMSAGATAMTDVTGFGLIGHLKEMLGDDADLGVEIYADAIPLLPGVWEHLDGGMIPAGAYRNRDAAADGLSVDPSVTDGFDLIVCDPQTSGGLAVAVPPGNEALFIKTAGEQNIETARVGLFARSGLCRVVPGEK